MGGGFGSWEKNGKKITVGIILARSQLDQHVFQIFVDLESVCFYSLYQTVNNGTDFCVTDGIRIHVALVFLSKGEETDGELCGLSLYQNKRRECYPVFHSRT